MISGHDDETEVLPATDNDMISRLPWPELKKDRHDRAPITSNRTRRSYSLASAGHGCSGVTW